MSDRFKYFFSVISFCIVVCNVFAQQPDLLKYVNTLQGTNSKFELTYGNTYPTIALPFGMNTWYVLSALGLYAVCPGTDQYVIGSPVFQKATITLENGKKFIIQADNNNKQNVYINDASLNGKSYSHNWISYSDIINGGTLLFNMNNQPNKTRALKPEDRPFSLSNQ